MLPALAGGQRAAALANFEIRDAVARSTFATGQPSADRVVERMAHTMKPLDELTALVRARLVEFGASGVRFTIRPLPYEAPNWCIDTEPPLPGLRRDEQAALIIVRFELRSRYDLHLVAA